MVEIGKKEREIMRVIFDYCRQPRSYADSVGECLIELEGDETIQDVKDKYINVKRHGLEQKYSNAREISEYVQTNYKGEKIAHSGRLVLMNTWQHYLD